MVFSLLYSFGKINHDSHVWIISVLLMCFIDSKSNINNSINRNIITSLQTIFLTHYVSSGLWKLKRFENFDFDYFTKTILDHISYSVVEGNLMTVVIKPIIQNCSWLLGLGLIAVLCFQISCVVPILFRRFYIFYGCLILFFHLSVGVVLSIWFSKTVLGVLFFLVYTEFLKKEQQKIT